LEKKDLIIQTFQQVGITLNSDGSEDGEIKIKDLEGIEVGEWELDVDVTQEEDEDSAALEAVLEAGKAPELPPVLEDDLDNDDKQDINITKASLRLRRQYFTAKEVESGDLLIINNEEDITTNSSTGLEDGDDDNSDESFDADGDDDDIEDHIME
jgi:hypothetical protein